MKKFILFPILLFAITSNPAAGFAAIAFETTAKQAIVIDYETGAVLMEKNPDEKMPTSSMSKVITTYLVFEALENGALKLDDTFNVSEKAWSKQGSKMFVDLNTAVKVEDLLQGVIVQSGNDATIVLAEGLAGTEDAFAAQLNKKAQELGMTNSHFMNASGWPDPEHYSTARDLAILGRALIKNFPKYYKYFAEKEYTYNKIKQGNRNPLLYHNGGGDGIKTGHTEDGGYGLMGSGIQDGRRVVFVLNGMKDGQDRAEQSERVLEWALKNFENKNILQAGQVLGEAPVLFGQKLSVPLMINESVLATMPKVAAGPMTMRLKYNGPLKAPVKKGDPVGTVEIKVPGIDTPIEYPLLAGADVPELGIFFKTLAKARYFLSGSQS